MKRRFVNLERTDENIADQYQDIFDGLQKDAIQNSWDAKLTKKGKNWKLIFRYDPVYNALTIEDFGTSGMNEEKWEHYQGLWHTNKGEDYEAAGSRGQGKFLFHYFSKDKLVLTETIDENGFYRFSYGTNQEYEDEERSLSAFIHDAPKLDHQGTKIWILNIKDDLKKELLDIKRFSELITASWWEIIRNYNAIIILNFDGSERIISNPTLFSANPKKEKNYPNEEIKKLGKVRNLVIRYLNEDIPPLFQGILIQRAGMTILRIPVRADEAIKKRTYGYCNFDEGLESELKQCELPNHMGFTTKRAWTYVREFIEHKLDNFVLELGPKREKITADPKILDEAVRLINKLVSEYIPELDESEGPTPTSSEIYISSFFSDMSDKRKVDFGENIRVFCKITNDAQRKTKLILLIKIFNCSSKINKFSNESNITLKGSSKQDVEMPSINFEENKDEEGQYIAEAILRDETNGQEIDRRRFDFYVNQEPPLSLQKPIRIESFKPNERKIDYGETLTIDCGITNETSNKENLVLLIKIYHGTSGDKKYNDKFSFELYSSSRKTIDIPLLDFDEKRDKPGKYIGEAILKIQKTGKEIDNRRFIFYVHEEPPKGKGFVKKFEIVLGRGLFFEKWHNLPINEKGEIGIIWDHPEFERLREQAKVKSKKLENKEIMLYCTKCGADEAMRKSLEMKYNEKKLTIDELKDNRKNHDELIYDLNISIFNNI
ncbi:MAG: hypothetical protein NTW06_00215 [Candidatus Falkowbacteria bacterium]|nr:hypothetical protein [Candidatus Falkowbacteria bacterium]